MWCRVWALILTCASAGSFRLACSKGRGRGLLMALELGHGSAVDLRLNTKLRTEGGGQTHDGKDEQNGELHSGLYGAFFAFLH